MEKFLLGIDIGTSACKAAVFSLDGRVAAQATSSYPVYYPAPGFVEQNPDEWWRGVCQVMGQVMREGGFDKSQIAGIGVDGQSWSAIPVDRRGRALHNTPIWMDTRAAAICEEVTARVGFDRIFAVGGNAFEPSYSAPKMLWFKYNKPDMYRNTHLFLQSNSYIVCKLTGAFTQDISQGYGVQAFDIRAGRWDDALCAELGLDRERLPEIRRCHEVVGEVTAEAARETGLAPGTPVVAGGLDACCGTLGAGVYESGQTQEQGGTAGGMSICMNEPLAHPKLILSFHVVPGRWLLQGGTTGGGALNWLRQQIGAEYANGENIFDRMCQEASTVGAGSEGLLFLPYMAGERSPLWDRHAKGVFFGLGYDKTRAHVVRSVLEGCAYALEHNLRTAYESGVIVNELNAMGGAANSLVWTQIKSDVTGKAINVPRSDTATTLGAAMLAGVGTGCYREFGDAVAATVRIARMHRPDEDKHRIYAEHFEIYLELYEKLNETMEKIDHLSVER